MDNCTWSTSIHHCSFRHCSSACILIEGWWLPRTWNISYKQQVGNCNTTIRLVPGSWTYWGYIYISSAPVLDILSVFDYTKFWPFWNQNRGACRSITLFRNWNGQNSIPPIPAYRQNFKISRQNFPTHVACTKKLMFERAAFLHTRTKNQALPYECKNAAPGAAQTSFFGNRVCDKFESFVYAAKFCSFPLFWQLEFWLKRCNGTRPLSTHTWIHESSASLLFLWPMLKGNCAPKVFLFLESQCWKNRFEWKPHRNAMCIVSLEIQTKLN